MPPSVPRERTMKGHKMEHAAPHLNDGYCDARSHERTSAPGRKQRKRFPIPAAQPGAPRNVGSAPDPVIPDRRLSGLQDHNRGT
jgi:hypothetical protein